MEISPYIINSARKALAKRIAERIADNVPNESVAEIAKIRHQIDALQLELNIAMESIISKTMRGRYNLGE